MKRTPEELTLLKLLGHAIWRSELNPKSSPEERKTIWTEDRSKYLTRATKLLKSMSKEGLSIGIVTADDKAPAE